jgi:quercetin dioxygenase-like cupin family protein
MEGYMIQPARLLVGAITLALAASACSGSAVAPSASAPAPSLAATAAPTLARVVVPATAQGATALKLSENKVVVTDGVAPDLAPGNYVSTVLLVTIEKGGRLPAHTHPGVEWIYVLQGTVDLRTAGGTRLILTRGQTGGVPPGTVVQAINGGETTVKILAHLMTLETAPFQTNVDTAP